MGTETIDIYKPQYNDEARTLQFRRPDGLGQLNENETIVQYDVTCFDKNLNIDVTADMISDVAVYDLTQIRYRLKGGVINTQYLLRFHITSSNGQKLEERVNLMVT